MVFHVGKFKAKVLQARRKGEATMLLEAEEIACDTMHQVSGLHRIRDTILMIG